ncbi:MAG TPA: LysR family transcriptional regulator [Opitutaceae bacterium]|nr:LysR family transcriptional regulator [Opitutaceae bacterium]
MELRHLRTFLAVAGTLNISEAARRMHVTQPALSRHIRDLEYAVGHPLFYRGRGRLRLTAAGATLRRHGARAVAAVDSALQQARGAADQGAAVLRVGYYGTLWATLVAPALQRLRRELGRIETRISEQTPAQLAAAVRDGRLDVALVGPINSIGTREVVVIPAVTVDTLVAMAADHPLAKKRVLALADLRRERIVSFARHATPGRESELIAACRAAGFTPKITRKAVTLPALLLAVAAGDGVAFVTRIAARAPHPGTVFTEIAPPGVPLTINVAYRRDSPPAARRLAELIAAAARISGQTGRPAPAPARQGRT